MYVYKVGEEGKGNPSTSSKGYFVHPHGSHILIANQEEIPARNEMDALAQVATTLPESIHYKPTEQQASVLAIASCASLLRVFPPPCLFDILITKHLSTVYLHVT
jgi:hypothetical protein